MEYIIFLRSSGVYFNGNLEVKYYNKIYEIPIGHSNKFHPNQKPLGLIRKFLKVSSKKGDLVLDPFIGSGTTALACKQLSRQFVGFEINPKYFKIANQRIEQTNLIEVLNGIKSRLS